MIADLLRLASIGQNMELYATSLRLQQQQQRQHQLANQHRQDNNYMTRNAASLGQASAHQPLDLSVRQNTVQEHKAQAEATNSASYAASKLISSSTSPAGSSASSYSSISSLSSCTSSLLSSTELISGQQGSARAPAVAACEHKNHRRHSVIRKSAPASAAAQATTTSRRLASSSILKRGQHAAAPGANPAKQKGAKVHLCNHCNRAFARSDMLTRHTRLHSGVKPYQCNKCHQVFSRSDHLSTHERTHTGEKPYQCEFCAYSACRRDMITRHMRTHSAHSAAGRSAPASAAIAQ